MQFTLATIALAAATVVSAQGVASGIAPPTPPPAGCNLDYPSNFEITVVLPAKAKRSNLQPRQSMTCAGTGTLVAKIKGGVMTDALGRIGAIVANNQFQFDGPPAQTGSIYTGGWSVCGNGSLALGGSAVFYQCLSGTFYNLYNKNVGAQCSPVEIDVIPCTVGAAGGATQVGDGQIQATSAGPKVTQIGDGQVQASSAGAKVTQIPDGQIQVSSAGPKVTQIPDGQIQVSSAGPKVTQIPDGQIQVSSAVSRPPVSQFTDGQLQVTAMPTVKAAPPVVSQISDGQIQASFATTRAAATATRPVVSQITDGQVQAPSASAPAASSSRAPVTVNAAPMASIGPQIVVAAVALAGFALL